ncbi:helix-turn-helix domain-containing protein [Myceligenerans halotolerans]
MITPAELGDRIELARVAARKTQAELATALGVDRTAISKITTGTRKVSAIELSTLASFLDRPLPWFVADSPEPLVARRSGVVEDRPATLVAELAAEDLTADVQQLRELGALEPAEHAGLVGSLGRVETPEDAAEAARRVREEAGLGQVQLGRMADVLDDFGLYTVSVVLGEATDGVMLPSDGFGVAVINANQDPGRRRFTAAHELGHYLFDDVYSAETVSGATSGHEHLVNAFAVEFLLPLAVVRQRWAERIGAGAHMLQRVREEAIWLSSMYRISWSGLLARLVEAGLITDVEVRALRPNPTRAELRAFGQQPEEDLAEGDLSASVSRGGLAAYRDGSIGRSRCAAIVRVPEDDLPEPVEAGPNELRPDFYS